MTDFVTRYFCAKRVVIKVFQIFFGFIICVIICSRWYGGRSCFGEGRLGFASGLNFIVLILNFLFLILLFVLCFCNIYNTAIWKFECFYSLLCAILFCIAVGLLVWYMIQYNDYLNITIALFAIQAILFFLDAIILWSEAFN